MPRAKCANLHSLELSVLSAGSRESFAAVRRVLEQLGSPHLPALRINFHAHYSSLCVHRSRLPRRLAFATLLASPRFVRLRLLSFVFYTTITGDELPPLPPMLGEIGRILSDFDSRHVLVLSCSFEKQPFLPRGMEWILRRR